VICPREEASLDATRVRNLSTFLGQPQQMANAATTLRRQPVQRYWIGSATGNAQVPFRISWRGLYRRTM
jgi:hypothetical protein